MFSTVGAAVRATFKRLGEGVNPDVPLVRAGLTFDPHFLVRFGEIVLGTFLTILFLMPH